MEINSLTKSIRVHPVFLIGLHIQLIAAGALFAETLFIPIVAVMSIGMIPAAVLWLVIGGIIMLLGISASFKVGEDAE